MLRTFLGLSACGFSMSRGFRSRSRKSPASQSNDMTSPKGMAQTGEGDVRKVPPRHLVPRSPPQQGELIRILFWALELAADGTTRRPATRSTATTNVFSCDTTSGSSSSSSRICACKSVSNSIRSNSSSSSNNNNNNNTSSSSSSSSSSSNNNNNNNNDDNNTGM